MTRCLMLFSLLCMSAVTVLSAQQAAKAVPALAQASVTAAGPRIQAAWPRYEPSAQTSAVRTYASSSAADLNDSHTLVFSTLGLIVVGVVAFLLIAH
jgi:hypothetical protein